MVMFGIVVQLALGMAGLTAPEVQYFPGSYFNDEARAKLQRRAMERWPGPWGLTEFWTTEELDEDQRVGLLLGAAAFHDPFLIPIYREAIGSPSERVRLAALYGYRDLIGDAIPGMEEPLDDRRIALVGEEMRAVGRTLRRQPLAAMWLQAALSTEDGVLAGYRGVVPTRPAAVTYRALETVTRPEDLDLVARAYDAARGRSLRIALLRLIEGLALEVFVEKPKGANMAWGPEVYDRAFARLDAWLERWRGRGCTLDYRQVVSQSMARLGAVGVDPLHPEACTMWLAILERGPESWWGTAAQRLYECGGPWVPISSLRSSSQEELEKRRYILGWYGVR